MQVHAQSIPVGKQDDGEEVKRMKKKDGLLIPRTRRQFLKTAAAAGGAVAMPYMIPSSALGKDGHTAPSNRIVMGGIGIGGRGSLDLRVFLGHKDVQFVGICDVQKARCEAAVKRVNAKYGNNACKTYSNIHEIVAQPDIDAMLIATGDRWHAPAAILAMRAGKDVYVEKPSCFTMDEGLRVVETARRYGCVYQTGTQRLSEPNHVFAIQMALSGRLGKIHTVYADIRYRGGNRFDWLPGQPQPSKDVVDWDAWLGTAPWRPYNQTYLNHGWYNYYDFATDTAMWGAHTIAQCVAGLDMKGVTHIEFEFAKKGETIVTKLSNGVKMVLIRNGNVTPWKPNEYWRGACGERFDGPEGWAGAADGYSKPDVSSSKLLVEYKKVLAEYTTSTQRSLNHWRNFLDCVKSRQAPVANEDVMYNSMIMCLAADICDLLQRNLKFDFIKAEFVDDPEANRLRARAMRESWCV